MQHNLGIHLQNVFATNRDKKQKKCVHTFCIVTMVLLVLCQHEEAEEEEENHQQN